jgi:hypothetical protein
MSATVQSLDAFVETGFCAFEAILPAERCRALLREARASREFSSALFLTEKAYRAAPQHRGVNPIPGRNLLERLDARWVQQSEEFRNVMDKALGPGWRVLDSKFVCGVPHSWMPQWLLAETRGLAVANLGPYVKPENRDITYFHGIDFHQDIIDYKSRSSDFVTAYVYLDDTTVNTSPLYVVPGSHRFGATTFPHGIELDAAAQTMVYSDQRGRKARFEYRMLTGPAGSLYVWHPCILHGTRPHAADEPRLSLRYLLHKAEGAAGAIDEVNRRISGPLALDETRVDLDEGGQARMRGNIINRL